MRRLRRDHGGGTPVSRSWRSIIAMSRDFPFRASSMTHAVMETRNARWTGPIVACSKSLNGHPQSVISSAYDAMVSGDRWVRAIASS